MFEILTEEHNDAEPNMGGENFHQEVVEKGSLVFERSYKDKYPSMAAMFESADPSDNYIGGMTSLVMKNQERFIEGAKKKYGESVITNKLGDLAPRILDVVRI